VPVHHHQVVANLREELPSDIDAIRTVHRLAFDDQRVIRLVDQLREDGDVVASLVAVEHDQIVGHIMFSVLQLDRDGQTLSGASLTPLGVLPERQRLGIGSALVRRGLDLCRERDRPLVIVLGHPSYYPRFGFSSELGKRVKSPYGDAFMALSLDPTGFPTGVWTPRYPAAFRHVDKESRANPSS